MHELLHSIIERPKDIPLRLMYADWLEQTGDPQAELIRIQCRCAQTESEQEKDDLEERADELIESHYAEWTEGISPKIDVDFILGLPGKLNANWDSPSAGDFAESALEAYPIESLYIGATSYNMDDVNAIIAAVSRIKISEFRLCHMASDESKNRRPPALHMLPSLQSLGLDFCPVPPASVMEQLAELRQVMVSDYPVDFGDLATATNLEEIVIHSTMSGFSALDQFSKLTRLELRSNAYTDGADLSSLRRLKNLATLTLDDTGFDSLDGIAGCDSLESLTIVWTRIGEIWCDIDMDVICSLPNLRNLSLETLAELKDYEKLANCKQLERLVLKKEDIDKKTYKKLVRALPGCHIDVGFGSFRR